MPTMLWGASPVMFLPLNVIVPLRGRLRPLMERSVVDFPAPLAPISVTISPSRTWMEMPLSAWMEP